MFCDGQCKKRNKKCGLLLDVYMKNDMTGDQKVIEQCALIGLFESMARQEQGQVRIQAAVESGRNETSKWMRNQNETMATGFLGLIHMVNEDDEAYTKIKYLGRVKDKMIEKDTDIVEGEVEDGSV